MKSTELIRRAIYVARTTSGAFEARLMRVSRYGEAAKYEYEVGRVSPYTPGSVASGSIAAVSDERAIDNFERITDKLSLAGRFGSCLLEKFIPKLDARYLKSRTGRGLPQLLGSSRTVSH